MSHSSGKQPLGSTAQTPFPPEEAFGEGLRRSYSDVLKKDVPDDLKALIEAMRLSEKKRLGMEGN